ncbi:MAG: hypothetical protein DWQ10_10880 [Calditrichaeota bacterium]|nr:MAG: hypothetical protein DWQ10_10880 [Calditrichota bacterium]
MLKLSYFGNGNTPLPNFKFCCNIFHFEFCRINKMQNRKSIIQTSILVLFIFVLAVPNLFSGIGGTKIQSETAKEIPLRVQFRNGMSTVPLLEAFGLDVRNPKTELSMQQLARESLGWLNTNGYYFAVIDTLLKRQLPQPHIFLYITTGKKTNRLHVTVKPTNDSYKQEWQASLAHAESVNKIEEKVFTILEELSEHGYPFAKIVFDSIALADDSVHSEWHLSTSSHVLFGPYVVLDSIAIRGNNLTKDKVIRRELGIKTGDVYRESRLQYARDRLQRLGIFNAVSEPQLYYEKGRSLLQVVIREGNTNVFNGVAGYNPGRDGESGDLTGTLDLQFGNLLGTGMKMAARWEKRNRHTQELASQYREPWFLNYPVHLQGGFQQLIQDTLYIERQFEFSVEWPFRDIVDFVGKLERKTVNPDSFGIVLYNLQKSSALAAGIGLKYESRDNSYNPRRGVYYYTMVESVQKQAGGSFKQQKLSVDLQWLLPLWRLHVLSTDLHWRHISSTEEQISFADQYRLGGATTLRGYREEQFRGDRIAWANLEYRYLLGRRSRAFVFYDAGSVTYGDAAGNNEFLSSYGVGVRMETKLGVVGLDYGLGEGDGLSQGKIHVSLINSF